MALVDFPLTPGIIFLTIPRVAHDMPAPLPVSVRVRDLAKCYRALEALRGVSFDVEAE